MVFVSSELSYKFCYCDSFFPPNVCTSQFFELRKELFTFLIEISSRSKTILVTIVLRVYNKSLSCLWKIFLKVCNCARTCCCQYSSELSKCIVSYTNFLCFHRNKIIQIVSESGKIRYIRMSKLGKRQLA